MNRQLSLTAGIFLLSTLVVGCKPLMEKLEGKKPVVSSEGASKTDPGRPSIAILERGDKWESYSQDLYRAGATNDIYVTTVADPFLRPFAVFQGKDESKNWTQVGTADFQGVTEARSGWVFFKSGQTPRYQAAGSRDDLVKAAVSYFGDDDLAKAFPWRAVVYISGPTENLNMALKQYEAASQLVAQKDVYATKWVPGSEEPIKFPAPGGREASLSPTKITQEQVGWIFAEEGKDPQFQAAASLPEVVKHMSTYFQLELSNRSRLSLSDSSGGQGAGAARPQRGMRGPMQRGKGAGPQKMGKIRRQNAAKTNPE